MDKGIELVRELKKIYEDKETVLSVLTCVSDYDEDIDELLTFIKTHPNYDKEDLLFVADSIEEKRKALNKIT